MDKRKYASEKDKENAVQSGILYSSGMIAGEGIVGILLAVFAVLNINTDISDKVNLGNIGGLVAFAPEAIGRGEGYEALAGGVL